MKKNDPTQINLKELLAENEKLKSENKKLLRAVGKAQLRNETAEEIIEDYKKRSLISSFKSKSLYRKWPVESE